MDKWKREVDWQNTDSIWHAHPSNHRLQPGGTEYYRYEFVKNQIEPGCRVLDVGCNCGQLIENLTNDLRCECVGIEIVADFVLYCHRNKPGDFYHGDFSRMPAQVIEDLGKFDYVTALEVIEHPIDVAGFTQNVWQALKRDGRLIITTPHPEGIYGWDYMEAHAHHVRMWSAESLAAAFGDPLYYKELYSGDNLCQIGAVFERGGLGAVEVDEY